MRTRTCTCTRTPRFLLLSLSISLYPSLSPLLQSCFLLSDRTSLSISSLLLRTCVCCTYHTDILRICPDNHNLSLSFLHINLGSLNKLTTSSQTYYSVVSTQQILICCVGHSRLIKTRKTHSLSSHCLVIGKPPNFKLSTYCLGSLKDWRAQQMKFRIEPFDLLDGLWVSSFTFWDLNVFNQRG